MVDCTQLWINHELYYKLSDTADPCNTSSWCGPLEKLGKGTVGQTYKAPVNIPNIPNLRPYYVLKSQPVNQRSTREKETLKMISTDMLEERAPLLFPFLYLDYVCDNDLFLLLQPAQISLGEVISQHYSASDEWWAEVLYQLAKAIYYLEEKKINHNDLTYDNVMFQYLSKDYKELALMLIDFGSVVQGHQPHDGLPAFTLGRDLNYFLYILIYDGIPKGYFPKSLGEKLYPFIMWEDYPSKHNEDPYTYGLRRANLVHHNWRTSGKHLSRWLAKEYPYVTDRCSLQRLDKLYGVAFGAVVGDAFGMPIEFDHTSKGVIKNMQPSGKYYGLLSAWDLPPGTFTDDTQMALALIDAVMSEGRALIPTAVAREYKKWADSEPIDIGKHTATVFAMMTPNGSNWEEISYAAYQEKPGSAANGATMRTWPIPILHHFGHYSQVVDSAIKQSQVSHMNTDAVYAAVFVSCLTHKLINGAELEKSIDDCLKLVKKYISPKLYAAISEGHTKPYKKLNGGTGWIVHTMEVVMWAIRNTNNFRDAIIRAANVRGDTDTNASIAGGIAGALYGYEEIPKEWVKVLDKHNDWNVWNDEQVTVKRLKDIVATLAQC